MHDPMIKGDSTAPDLSASPGSDGDRRVFQIHASTSFHLNWAHSVSEQVGWSEEGRQGGSLQVEKAEQATQKSSSRIHQNYSAMSPLSLMVTGLQPLLHLFNPSRFFTSITTHFQSLILRILRAGPVPRHVAFVMDGNRRFARERGWVVRRGHEEGFESLKSVRGIPRLFFVLFLRGLPFRWSWEDTISLCGVEDTVYHCLCVLD